MNTLQDVLKAVEQIDTGVEPGSDAYNTEVMMVSALVVGPNVRKLRKFTGLPGSFLAERAKRLRENGVWVGGRIYADWLDEADGGISFICDCLVAQGMLDRTA